MIPGPVHCFLYTDALVLVAHSPEKLQAAVEEWTKELRRTSLAINPEKSKVMHFGREENLRILCDSQQLEERAEANPWLTAQCR